MGYAWADAEDDALFLWHEMQRCEEIARQLEELEHEAPTAALREEVRRMRQQVEDIRRLFFAQLSLDGW
ncbi:YgaB family protein [Geobacillus sp. FSL W8-0032]|uniref:Uncharacterized protein n=1 Tax=Geobacillus subterraneus TaxID=129338 RepID=A0A679FUM0_9BACL|nr:YgaB family protein [Geobacillus subterraneus]BBW98689.1 hypothetical protein GsuE55_35220 [Geobacillus subterraneus]